MKVVGEAASADEEAMDPEQIAKNNHRKKKIKSLPSELGFYGGKQTYQL